MTRKEMLDNIDIDGIQRERENLEHMPNQKWHQIVSFIKSGFRLARLWTSTIFRAYCSRSSYI